MGLGRKWLEKVSFCTRQEGKEEEEHTGDAGVLGIGECGMVERPEDEVLHECESNASKAVCSRVQSVRVSLSSQEKRRLELTHRGMHAGIHPTEDNSRSIHRDSDLAQWSGVAEQQQRKTDSIR